MENWRDFVEKTRGFSNSELSKIILVIFKKRLREYLQDKPVASNFLSILDKAGIKWGVTGGGVRDMIFNLPVNDLDIVVDCSDEELEKIIEDNDIEVGKINRFGGRKLRLDPHTELVDVWTVGNTWGIRKGYVKNRGLSSYPEATTYSTDAVVISPSSNEIYADHFIDSIRNEEINIVFGKTPIAVSTLEKMHRLVKKYNLKPGSDALKFIDLINQKRSSLSKDQDFEMIQESDADTIGKKDAQEVLYVLSVV